MNVGHEIKACALCAAAVFGLAFSAEAAEYDVAAYVWPAYQPEPRWAELGIFGDGKGEWQNLYEAKKRQECDYQGVKPLWGYEDESDPVAVARKIDAATAAGVNVFIYDWYWYGGRPFLENALDKGFLGAKNCERMKFYVMWANHDVTGLWNNKMSTADGKNDVIWPAKVSDEDFNAIVDRWIKLYFSRPNYYKIDGNPVLSIYDIGGFVKWDGLDKAKSRLAYLRERVKSAGFPGVHLQVVGGYFLVNAKDALPELGVDSFTSYSWNDGTWGQINDKTRPEFTYSEWGEAAVKFHDRYMAGAKAMRGSSFSGGNWGRRRAERYTPFPAAEVKLRPRRPLPRVCSPATRTVPSPAPASAMAFKRSLVEGQVAR